jgi:zinc protease
MSSNFDTAVSRLSSTGRGLAPVRAVLDGGATVVAKESRVAPAVTLNASLRAGTIADPASLAGLSHFVSKVLDRGTASRTADEIAEELDSRGVSLSVAVNRHALSLFCTCLVEDVEAILALLADIIRHPIFPQAEIETRRGEIVTLIRQDEENPAVIAAESLMAMLYGDAHPYGRPPRGTLDSVRAIDRGDLQRFHSAWFSPENFVLAMVGDIEPSRAIAMSADAFEGWTAPPIVAEGPDIAPLPLVPPPAHAERRVRVLPMMNKAQADIAYGFTSILRADPAFQAYNLMNNILGQYSLGGRLGDSIRERQGMAYYVYSALDANVIPGPLMVRAGVNPANVERALASIDEEVAKFAAEGPTEEEVQESRQYLIGSMPRTLETNAGIASYLQMIEYFGLGLDYDLRVPGLLQAVTRDDVVAAARQSLQTARAQVAIAGPYNGSPR